MYYHPLTHPFIKSPFGVLWVPSGLAHSPQSLSISDDDGGPPGVTNVAERIVPRSSKTPRYTAAEPAVHFTVGVRMKDPATVIVAHLHRREHSTSLSLSFRLQLVLSVVWVSSAPSATQKPSSQLHLELLIVTRRSTPSLSS